MIRRPPRSTHCISSAASDVYKRQAVSNGMFILAESQETDNTFVASELSFPDFCKRWVGGKFEELIEPCRFFLNGISQFAQSPVLFIDHLSTMFGDDVSEFFFTVSFT
eukprot:TRINITY_DN4931_c0_g1_i3.p2 TRINITY_DN4931_c0_g1~~TRINITY_DN4931_c0_g1_i3.p2  ORF type:complete len:108 (+),score=20.38 TRINITY_DN4931_c0_g1_i3:120-443(+)